MTHTIGMADYGDFRHAWVLDLPGCIVGGQTIGAIESMLPIVIAEHIGWLASHGEQIEHHGDWRIVETLDGIAKPDFCFDAEKIALTPGELDVLIRRMSYARDDLMAALAPLTDVVVDWTPPASAFESFDAWAPEARSIRGLVTHVLQLEAFYRGALTDAAAPGIYESVSNPEKERARTVNAFRAMDGEALSRVYRPRHPGQPVGGEWTIRKAVRRIISHERAHTAEIEQRRTWLLLGVPDTSRR